MIKIQSIIAFTAMFVISISCAQQNDTKTKIVWDTWGVPHISSNNIEELFFAQGWAQMQNHANLILELYGSSRGKGAEYWGASRKQNDMLVHSLRFSELADQWATQLDPEVATIYKSFVDGLNAYAQANPEAIEDKNKVVLPVTTKDLVTHWMSVVFGRFVGGGDLGRVQQWPDLGSNTLAIAPSRSASGNAMLVQNPHLPWWKEFLFFESHLILKGKSMYGSILVGQPGIAIGFNDFLGWSHTNNTIDNADTYELDMQEDGYLLDGEVRAFEKTNRVIKIKQDDGTMTEEEITLLKTVHGPVVKQDNNKVLAIRMAGTDRPNMALQWWKMINSSNFEEFESALQMAQIPFWNVMYADKSGKIFYLYNGLIPKRGEDEWSYWDRIIPGGKSADVWAEMHAYADLPKIHDPSIGWLQNANDPPWTSTIPMTLNPKEFPGYMAPEGMSFRPQRAARMMLEDESITFEELIEYKHSTRLEFADRILDDLFAAVDASGSEKALAAKSVLEAWDRMADSDSRGTLLFYSWARKFNVWDESNYTEKWNSSKPNTTPDGIANPDRAVRLLEETATEIESKFGALDTPWGEYFRINYNGADLPANGSPGSVGVFRVAWPGGGDDKHMYVGGGDSWVGVIEFGEVVKAKVLLSYGNATQKDSPHNGDQLELFSKKQLRDAWISDEDISANTKKVEIISGKSFVVAE